MPQKARLTFTITSGQSLSAAVALHGERVSLIEMPSSWTAAGLTFQGSNDNSTFCDIWDESGELQIAVAASRRIQVNTDTLSQQAYLKVRSGTAASPVAQGGTRTLYLEIWS
jgi:hypothetical protein